ncbi:MAG: TerC family protein [Candidatus Eisenbacteria bacterium]
MSVVATGWVVFAGVVAVSMALDLFVFNRQSHVVKLREALWTSAFWIALAAGFGVWIMLTRGHRPGLEFATGYLIELSLSVDNLFVFLLLFTYFAVPPRFQHQVLFWGILGAVVFRLTFILAGVALLRRFEWILYLFGLILVVSGVRMGWQRESEVHPERNPVLRLLRKLMPITPDYEGGKFLVRRGGLYATPLLVVLVMLETTDLVFAVDSIPAVLAITRDPFIVFTSNVFAILGLRALFFSLAGVMRLFHYLHYGLAFILVLVGVKMLISHWIEIPTLVTLGIVIVTLAVCVIASLLRPRLEVIEPPGD